MARHDVRLSDRLDLTKSPVLLSGTQALVRLVLLQAARDRAAGWSTGGYVSGYRGSPLGGVDRAMEAARGALQDAGVIFHPGLNEDLAATAVWGTQTAALRGEGTVEGVYGLWYGKGPGVDRSGDALRHANLAGTAPRGGVLAVAGDDHTGESSTTCHQSELALIDAGMPVLSPAGVQEILDFGLYGYALSRYSGLWVGMKAVKDTVESMAVVDGRLEHPAFVVPDIEVPEGGLAIRLGDHWVAQDTRMVAGKWPAAQAFARVNGIDRRGIGHAGARIGIVASGKPWLDLLGALELLGITDADAADFGLTTYKVGQVWPLEEEGLRAWADGLSLVIVLEERRKILEPQIARALWGRSLRLWGAHGADGPLFPEHGALDPSLVALRLGEILVSEGLGGEALQARLAGLAPREVAPDLIARTPWFCAGCPHSSSTRLPEGARAGGGIGCHTMALWMDRGTEGYTHMGAEGATWIGEAPFSKVPHVFQNLGDGTYNHSGLQAIRAAVAAGVNITYKILYNDAVAMTGGQANDGGLSPERIAAEVMAAGVGRVAVVHDGVEGVAPRTFPAGVTVHLRDAILPVQEELQRTDGVTVLLYIQTCAAEKRRRRRTGAFPEIAKRVFIDPDVCEGCGDCGVQSNCVAILPLETPLGRKRQIDQASCNGDLSCLQGFCPSFLTVEGGKAKRGGGKSVTVPPVPEPELPALEGTWNAVITGIGGTGAVTIGAVLAMAAHLDEKGAGLIEMAGLAQKGGAVHIHCRIAERPSDINAIRVSAGQAHTLIGGDLVTSAGAATRRLLSPETQAIVNAHETPTGAFTQAPDFELPANALTARLEADLGSRLTLLDATMLATELLGDAIFANMLLTGAAWQKGLIPLEKSSIEAAIRLNGTAAERNLRAFELGRWAAADAAAVAGLVAPAEVIDQDDPDAVIALHETHLRAYQSQTLVRRYRELVDLAPDPELRLAIARGYHKLLTYKDEYEVARLLATSAEKARRVFEGDLKISYNLAPPFLSRPDATGRPRKRRFGPWLRPFLKPLASLKVLRGTALDPFGYSTERRTERDAIRTYAQDIRQAIEIVRPDTRGALLQLAELPLQIRGFGPVKQANFEATEAARADLLSILQAGPSAARHAAE